MPNGYSWSFLLLHTNLHTKDLFEIHLFCWNWKKLLTISTPIQQAINMFMKITGTSESLPLSKLEVHFCGLLFSSLFITSFWSAFVFLLFLFYFGYWICCFSRSTLESLLKKMEQLPSVAMMVHHIIYIY